MHDQSRQVPQAAAGVALVAEAWARFRRLLLRDAVLVAEHFVIRRQHFEQLDLWLRFV